MAVGALAGGALGGWLAGKIKPVTLRRIVIAIGLVVAVIYYPKNGSWTQMNADFRRSNQVFSRLSPFTVKMILFFCINKV